MIPKLFYARTTLSFVQGSCATEVGNLFVPWATSRSNKVPAGQHYSSGPNTRSMPENEVHFGEVARSKKYDYFKNVECLRKFISKLKYLAYHPKDSRLPLFGNHCFGFCCGRYHSIFFYSYTNLVILVEF